MSRIELNVVANGNFRNLETALTRLRSQVNALNASFMAGRGSELAMSQINGYVQGFEKAIDASGMFERHMVSVTSETNKFGRSLQSGNLRMNQLFRAAVDYRRGELGQIRQLAREQVRLQNATVLRMPDGRSQVIVPRGIDEAIDKQRILNQEYRIFRQVVSNGSTEIINWGKNTQWAGRQLTVGLTVPLTIFGATAGKMFMDADKQLVRLAKVYGDATKGMVDQKELENIRQQTLALGQELAATMGIAASETMGIAADLAATGKEGNELIDSTREAMRLSVLGEVDRQEAMRATLSIQSVFKKDTQGLAESINFLNAVENQTSTSLNDLVEGIVKAGPVVQGLGGDIEDLSLMMVAMREGGIPAAEAANAIKSSLASLINPTKQTRDVLQGFGIDLVEIVDKNAGNVIGTLVDLQSELSGLNDLSRQRAIEQIFGKFQFSRINAMLSNIGKAGSQTEQVMAIAGMSTTELAKTAEQELTSMTESVSGKFGRALESLKANLIPIGEVFVQVGTMLMNVGNKILEVFNSLPEPVKNLINGLGFITALAGPLIMITGVLGNFFGYIVKGISSFMALKRAGRGMFEAFTPESVAATNATDMLTESMFDQKVAISEMGVAIDTLITKLEMLVQHLNNVNTSSNEASRALANAESAAFASGGEPIAGYAAAGSKGTVTGFGRSHLAPQIGRGTYEYGAQVGATLIPMGAPGMGMAQQYQIAERETFSPEFYDPSSGISRRETLFNMASTPAGRQYSSAESGMSELAAQRLLPTREEYNKSVSEYMAKIRVLNSLPKEQTAAITQALKNQDIDGARAELKRVLDAHQNEYERFLLEERQEIESLTGDMKEVTAGAISRELEITSQGPFTTQKSGKGVTSLVYAESGGGVGIGVQEQLDAATRKRIEAMKLAENADRKIAESSSNLTRKTQEEIAAKNKSIKNMRIRDAYSQKVGAVEKNYVLVGNKWYQVTKDKIRLLDQSNKKDAQTIQVLTERNKAESDKARASRMAAEADKKETISSQNAAKADDIEAKASLNAAKADSQEAMSGRGRGRLTGLGVGGALGTVGMITSMIPAGEPGSGISQATDLVGGVAMGAGTGAMIGSIFPGIGTAIGAGVGGIIGGIAPVMGILSSNAENAAKELEKLRISAEVSSGKILDLESSMFEINPLRKLEDLPLDNFKLETEQATSQLYAFTEALKAAEEGTPEYEKVQMFKGMGTAEDLLSSSMFQQMMMSLVQSGTSETTVKSIMGGYLAASGKQDFSNIINKEIERIFDLGNTAQEIGINYANGLKKIADDAIQQAGMTTDQMRSFREADAAYESARIGKDGIPIAVQIDGQNVDVADLVQRVQQFASEEGMSAEALDEQLEYGPMALARTLNLNVEELGPEKVKEIMKIVQELSRAIPELSRFGGELDAISQASDVMTSSLKEAFVSADPSSLEKWINSIEPEILDESTSALNEFLNQLRMTGEGGKNAATAFDQMRAAGTSTSDALLITRMIISDVNTDWQQLAAMARNNPAEFEIVWTQYTQGGPPGGVPALGATKPEDIGTRLAGTIDYSSGAGGGGSPDTSAIDAQIEAQDKLIEKIKEEREERQKLLNLEKEAFDFAMREQDLKNQIAQARAEGRMADAALLQSQLDGERKAERQKEAERQKQEQEDRRIKKAEEEKERLQEVKQGMSGGSGGGGATGPSAAQQQWTANRIEILSSGVVNWTEGAELRAATLEKGPWSAFFESDKVKQYREELLELGVPIEAINTELNEMFESWIENNNELFGQTEEYKFIKDSLGNLKLGAEGVKEVLPEAFSVLLDKNLTESEKIDILAGQIYDLGFESDEARKKAEKLYKQYNENEFNSPGIDEEIEKWIIFNDTIKNLKRDLDTLEEKLADPNLTGVDRGNVASAARYTAMALEQTQGTAGTQLNAGGVSIDTAEVRRQAEEAGAAVPYGTASGISANTSVAVNAGESMIVQLLDRVKTSLGISSPSKVFEEIGINSLQGLALGMSGSEGYGPIETAFSTMIEQIQNIILDGFIELPDKVSPEIQRVSDTFYDIMTKGISDTVNEINKIVSTGIKDYEFKIQGMPGVYIPDSLDSFWRSALPGVYDNLSNFGQIYRAEGGYVSGPGGPTEDKIPAWLSDGEYVIKASSVNKYGTGLLDIINAGRFADGGFVKVSSNTSPLGQSIADFARPYEGTPYSSSAAWADGPDNGWGCATAMQWLYNQKFGINLPSPSLSAGQLAGLPNAVSRDSLLPGDLLFFYYKNGVNTQNPVNHVGMYMGNEQMFHARAPGLGTQITEIDDANYKAARRVVPQADIGMQFPRRYKMGGKVYGMGGPTQDNILAMLSNGEYVMNAMSVRKYGQEFMDALNKGELAEAAAGGLMSKYPGAVAKMSVGGAVKKYGTGGSVSGNNSNIEYNINVNVEGTNSSADEIANQVLKVMKQRDYMNRSVTRI